jgi:CO/xanthine dehydrogenase FAD-binding subunit
MSTGTYLQPASVDEALALLAEHDGAALVAGGTDLVVGTRQGKRTLPETLVAIHRLPGLDGIDVDGGTLVLGALATHDAIERSELVRDRWTALADASAIVGSPATRHVATLGGNLANASPAMETGAPLVVFDAEVELRSSGGSRAVPVESLWSGPGRTTAAPGEMITGVRVPAPADGSGSAYVRLEYRRSMEIAVVGAAALVTLSGDGTVADARVALTAVAPTIVRSQAAEAALCGSEPAAEAFAAAAAAVHDAAEPISDVRGTDAYRKAMIEVIARRAIEVAARRAAGDAVPVPATMTVGGTR